MRYLIILALLVSVNSQAQWKNYILSVKGDTLNRIDKNDLKQGPWVIHVDELRGERGYEEEGFFTNDQKEGVWRRFSLEGDLIAIETYRYGMKDGKSMYFTNAGEPLREESWRAIDPKNPYDTVAIYDVNDPTKVVRYQVVKVEPISYKHGTWDYYDPMRGTVEKTELWTMNQLKGKDAEVEEDDLSVIDVTKTEKKDSKKTVTKPKEVLEFEKKNSGKKKIKVRDGNTGG